MDACQTLSLRWLACAYATISLPPDVASESSDSLLDWDRGASAVATWYRSLSSILAMRVARARLTESGLETSKARRRGPMLFRRSSIAACDTELAVGGRTIGSPGACALRRSVIRASVSAAPRRAAL